MQKTIGFLRFLPISKNPPLGNCQGTPAEPQWRTMLEAHSGAPRWRTTVEHHTGTPQWRTRLESPHWNSIVDPPMEPPQWSFHGLHTESPQRSHWGAHAGVLQWGPPLDPTNGVSHRKPTAELHMGVSYYGPTAHKGASHWRLTLRFHTGVPHWSNATSTVAPTA